MKYIFFLGSNPTLSLAEITSILKKDKLDYKIDEVRSDFVILELEKEFNIRDLFVQMGGTIKIAGEVETITENDLEKNIISKIEKLLENSKSKKSIGYSTYFSEKEDKNKVLDKLEDIKKSFYKIKRDNFNNIRVVELQKNSTENPSASIFNNKLTNPKKGTEFNIIFNGSRTIISQTLIAQDIEAYSMRDYEKPGKDAQIGMMPPKLAQIMINLAEINPGQLLFDPFCGTGTILQEAALNDYKIIGSDSNGDQIQKCKQNLSWLSEKYILTYPEYKVSQGDFAEVMRKIKKDSIDAIVTESTLGPVYKKKPNKEEIKSNYNNLKKMHTRFLECSKNVLKSKGKIVITLPAYQIKPKEFLFAEFIDNFEKLGYSRLCPLNKDFVTKKIKTTKRDTIVYSRPNQIVAREIVVLEKK